MAEGLLLHHAVSVALILSLSKGEGAWRCVLEPSWFDRLTMRVSVGV